MTVARWRGGAVRCRPWIVCPFTRFLRFLNLERTFYCVEARLVLDDSEHQKRSILSHRGPLDFRISNPPARKHLSIRSPLPSSDRNCGMYSFSSSPHSPYGYSYARAASLDIVARNRSLLRVRYDFTRHCLPLAVPFCKPFSGKDGCWTEHRILHVSDDVSVASSLPHLRPLIAKPRGCGAGPFPSMSQ